MNIIKHNSFDTFKMLFKQIGGLLVVLGGAMVVPLIISAVYAEFYSVLGFLLSLTICVTIGLSLYKGIGTTLEPLNRHALIIAALGWLFLAIMGALPFLIIAHITPDHIANLFVPSGEGYSSSLVYFKNPLHAVFESMSAFTTTGLSMAVHEPSIGKGLLFYRSFAQWLGGAGIIVLAIAVLSQNSGRTALFLYGSESSGERLKPTVIETARSIWKIYLGITLFSLVYLVAGTLIFLPDYPISNVIFDSVNHAMAAQSTGGFSSLDNSIATYGSAKMEMLHILPMILGALSLPFFFRLFREKDIRLFWRDLQTRAVILFSIVGGVLLSFMLMESQIISEPFRVGLFQFVSALSTTGWQTADVHVWDSASIFFIVIAGMVVGGAAGATVGGIKMIRVLLFFKGILWKINGFFKSEHSIHVVEFNGKRLLPSEMYKDLGSAAIFSFVYLLFVFVSTLVTFYFMGDGYSISDALFESASAQGTVGLSCGITNPDMSPVLEVLYIVQMWCGRLEIIPVLVLFRTIIMGTRPVVV